ncbi:Kiwa anti-phage protein KwaB-like domain-containing protein [Sessilibacter corallicola]|uniref:DUF4868 domain-containing protein n=1 Tax=Sessilibacter corallicola TaxID=2904075 RepID=A0ABQ0A9K7_9GAMM
MPYNFMALIKDKDAVDPTVSRIAVGADLQEKLSEEFDRQFDNFIGVDGQCVPFDGQYKAEHDELLTIENFELPEIFKSAIKEPMVLQPLHYNHESDKKIAAIFCGLEKDDDYVVFFQVFESTRLIKPSLFNIVFGSNDTFEKLEYFGMTLDSKLTACYKSGQLYFRSYHYSRRIFDLSKYYREATEDEVKELASHDHFSSINQEEFLKLADHVVRQKIARITRNDVLNSFSVTELKQKAEQVNFEMEIVDQKIIIPNNRKDLKLILSFLDDQVYMGPITGQTKVSNSSRLVDNG